MPLIYLFSLLAVYCFSRSYALSSNETNECTKLNTSCETCVTNKQCMYCAATNSCLLYVNVLEWPAANLCPPGLVSAHWSSCSVDFKTVLIVATTSCGILLLVLITVGYCCVVRCLRRRRPVPRSEEVRDPVEDAYFRIQSEKDAIERRAEQRRREMQERNDEIRQKYGLRGKGAGSARSNPQYSYVHLEEQTA